MADPKIEDRSDEMEDDLHKLEDDITNAEKKLEARKEDAAGLDEATGEGAGETRTAEDVRAEVESKMTTSAAEDDEPAGDESAKRS